MSYFRMADRFIRLPELISKIGIGKSTIYNKMQPGNDYYDPTFPAAKRLGGHSVAWLESEIDAWMLARKAA